MIDIDSIREDYIDNFCKDEDAILKDLVRETAISQLHDRMISGKYQGNFLNLLVKITNPKQILEIGTYSGYSAICMARALSKDSKLTTIEINDEIEWLARKYFKLANLEDKINLIIGDATNIIPTLEENFDFVFIDGDKREYIDYFNGIFPLVKQNGLILVDNVIWNNKIFLPIKSNDHMTKGVVEFNEYIRENQSVEKIILPFRDGLMLLRKI